MTEPDSKQSSEVTDGNKEKMRSIMEAASALTSLGDSDSESSHSPTSNVGEKPENHIRLPKEGDYGKSESSESAKTVVKRHIPSYKKPDAAITFPEKLMSMMKYADKQEEKGEEFCIGWLPDGKSFVIRNPEVFTRKVLVKFFKACKFSSYTRKLYRWGFRQINRGLGPDDPIVFGNEFFQRDNEALIAKMRSSTAVSSRKTDPIESHEDLQLGLQSGKRGIDSVYMFPVLDEQERRKRILLESLIRDNASLGASPLAECQPVVNCPSGLAALDQNLNPSSLRVPQNTNLANPFRSSSLGYPMLYSKNLMGNPNPLSLYQAGATQQGLTAASSADIVNAAINVLRYSP